MLPNGFVYLEDPRIIKTMEYTTHDNFMGRPVAGYINKVCIVTEAAGKALIAIQDELDTLNAGYHLRIFDAYRPTQAVEDFIQWSKDFSDEKMRKIFYPDIAKPDLFKQGYIAERSSHSRGSTVDLTITVLDSGGAVNAKDMLGTDLDMGTAIDFFGELSHTNATGISDIAKKNRRFLVNIMDKHGFENYPVEWWHYTLRNEPFPDTYFNFPIK